MICENLCISPHYYISRSHRSQPVTQIDHSQAAVNCFNYWFETTTYGTYYLYSDFVLLAMTQFQRLTVLAEGGGGG